MKLNCGAGTESIRRPERGPKSEIRNLKSEIESLWTNDSERVNIPKMKTGRNFIFLERLAIKEPK